MTRTVYECKVCHNHFESKPEGRIRCSCGSWNVEKYTSSDTFQNTIPYRLFVEKTQVCEECLELMVLPAVTNRAPEDCHPAETKCQYNQTPGSINLWLPDEKEPAEYYCCKCRKTGKRK